MKEKVNRISWEGDQLALLLEKPSNGVPGGNDKALGGQRGAWYPNMREISGGSQKIYSGVMTGRGKPAFAYQAGE